MKKFDVFKNQIEVNNTKIRRYGDIATAFKKQLEEELESNGMQKVASFDTLDEARAYLNANNYASFRENQGFAVKYTLVEFAFIQENEYDDEDEEEWIGGGDIWDIQLPENLKKD